MSSFVDPISFLGLLSHNALDSALGGPAPADWLQACTINLEGTNAVRPTKAVGGVHDMPLSTSSMIGLGLEWW